MSRSSERYLPEQEAEERLRDAAPEMYCALIRLLRFVPDKPTPFYQIQINYAREAIAKAEGKQP